MYHTYYTNVSKFTMILLLSVLLLPNPSVAETAYWSEDFNDTDLSDWELSATDWTNDTYVPVVPHDWQIVNGTLTTGIERINNVYNTACKKAGDHITYFSASIYSGVHWGFGFQFGYNITYAEDRYWPQDSTPLYYFVFWSLNGYDVGYNGNPGEVGLKEDWNETTFNFQINYLQWYEFEMYYDSGKFDFYMDGDLLMTLNGKATNYLSFDTVCLVDIYGGTDRFDNIFVNQPHNTSLTSSSKGKIYTQFIYTIFGISTFGVMTYKGSNIYKKKRLAKHLRMKNHAKSVIKDLNKEFNLSDTSFLMYLGYKTDENYVNELKNSIPQDIINYRYLLHPIRLMILKLLSSELSLSSTDIKNILDISWGDFHTHIKSLQDKGYIEIIQDFDDKASLTQIISSTEKGRHEYKNLLSLLSDVVEKKTPLDFIINSSENELNELYPVHTSNHHSKFEEINNYMKEAKKKLEE